MNSNYFKSNEDNDFEMLVKFNEETKYFDKIVRSEDKNVIDATALKGDKCFNIELKMRSMNINQFDSIFIEPNKVAKLMLEYHINGIIPLYINFFQNQNTVAIWNLSKINSYKYDPCVKIWDEGHKKYKYEARFGLYPRDACICMRQNDNDKYNEIKPVYKR